MRVCRVCRKKVKNYGLWIEMTELPKISRYWARDDVALSQRYDAYYYTDTGEWAEPRCGDLDCEFCADRPKVHSQ